MQRRSFLIFTALGTAALLAGCKDDSVSNKFAGYWKADTKFPTYAHITENGESFLITMYTWERVFKAGYKKHKLSAAIDSKANNILIADAGVQFSLDADKDQLHAGNFIFNRISESDYNSFLAENKEKLL